MNTPVHILAFCRNPELFAATELVFKSLRIGFPTAPVIVTGNGLTEAQKERLLEKIQPTRGVLVTEWGLTHPQWIADLINNEPRPFFICDTDVIFHSSVERFLFQGPMSGRLIPQFRCPFTETITYSRLHTALLYIDPEPFRDYGKLSWRRSLECPFVAALDPVAQNMSCQEGQLYFHDTLGQAYHLLGGHPFNEEMLDCYDHVNCGSYLDLLDKKIPGSRERQSVYLNEPDKARGLWRQQQQWYETRAA